MNLPNLLTVSRIVLIVPVIACYLLPNDEGRLVAALLFTIAAATDWLDGWLARRWDLTSAFGAFLDPVADKLMVVTVLLLIVADFGDIRVTIPALMIVGRELFVTALREWMASHGARDAVAVAFSGKFKTTLQMIALIVLIASPAIPLQHLPVVGITLLWLAALLTVWSAWGYGKAGYRVMLEP